MGLRPGQTPRSAQFLAFIYYYTKLDKRPPAKADFQRYFEISAPSVHAMIKTLERNGLIARKPRVARSIQILVPREAIPELA